MGEKFDEGFFIAQKLPGGGPGRPIGNEDGAIMVFEELALVAKIRGEMAKEHGSLGIFRINVVLVGEVIL